MNRLEDLPLVNGVPKPKTYRQTFLRVFDECPRAGYLQLKHDGGPANAELNRGRVFHETAERITRTLVQLGEQRIDQHDAKAILDEVIADHPEWPVPVREMEALRLMTFHYAEHFTCPSSPLIEQLFHLRVGDSVVSGTVDLAWVDGDTFFIRDYKTGPGFPSHDEVGSRDPVTGRLRGAKSFQLIVYTLLIADGKPVAKDWPLPPGINRFDVSFVYPFHLNGAGDGLLERGLVIERPELIEHRAWLAALVRRVEDGFSTGRWPALPGPMCEKRCPARAECPLPELFRKGVSLMERDPADAAEELLFLESDASELRKGLKEIALRTGPIRVGDMELSHKRTDSRRMTKKGKELLAAGKPIPSSEYQHSESLRFDWRKAGDGF